MSAGRKFGGLRGDLWVRPDFAGLSPTTKLVYLFAFSHRDGNAAGVFRLPALFIAHDAILPIEQVEDSLAELAAAGWVSRSGEWLALLKMMEHDTPPNRNAAIGAARAVLKGMDMAPGLDVRPMLPELHSLTSSFKDGVLADAIGAIEERLGNGMDTVSIPYSATPDRMETVSHHNHHYHHHQDHHNAKCVTLTPLSSSSSSEPEPLNPVRQRHDDMMLEIEQLSDDLRALDSPHMRKLWMSNATSDKNYTTLLIRHGYERLYSKENTQ